MVDDSMESLISSTAAKKIRKSSSRKLKNPSATTSHKLASVALEGRYRRVRKACERCRMMKTKCDGELPCKKCINADLVCVPGWRKNELKGGAEVLENTQDMLIATVKKLYTMVRNGESWNLGEPDTNEEGLPIIHSIVEKLVCIRPSADLPCAIPAKPEEFAKLKSKLHPARPDHCDEPGRNISRDLDGSLMCSNALSMPTSDSITHPNIADRSTDFALGDWRDGTAFGEYELEADFNGLERLGL